MIDLALDASDRQQMHSTCTIGLLPLVLFTAQAVNNKSSKRPIVDVLCICCRSEASNARSITQGHYLVEGLRFEPLNFGGACVHELGDGRRYGLAVN